MNISNNIVITGASGFVGRHLLERLNNTEGYKVFAFSSKPNELKAIISGNKIEYFYKDEISSSQISGILNNAIVINCAYPRNYNGMDIADGLKYIKNVFKSAVENRAKFIINTSSQSVYSQHRSYVATENTPLVLEDSYAVGKYAVELLLESICEGTDTKYTNLRMASLIGPGFDQRIVNRFAIKMMQHEQIKIFRQDKYMGFLDISDAVEAIMSVVENSDNHLRTVYNVGNAKGYTIEEIFNLLASILKKRMEVTDPIIEVGFDKSTSAVSYELLKNDTGFIPKVELDESIEKIVSYLEEK